MRMPTALRNLDDKVLGDRLRRRSEPAEERPTEHDEQHDDERDQRRRGRDVAETEEAADERSKGGTGDGLRDFLAIFYRIARLVLLLLAALLVLAIVFTYANTNKDNTIVSHVLDYAKDVAGPFKDVFTVKKDAKRAILYNYGLAAVVYVALSLVVQRLPLPGRKVAD